MRKALASSFVALSILFLASSPVSAQKPGDLISNLPDPGAVDIGHSLLAPSSPFYFIKILREKIELLLAKSDETKIAKEIEFSQRRLREMLTLISSQRQDLIKPTLQRYQQYLVEAEKIAGDNRQFQSAMAEALSRNLDVLERAYDSVGNPEAKSAILANVQFTQQQTQDLISKLPQGDRHDVGSKTAVRLAATCSFLLRESTASGQDKQVLNQKGEQCKTFLQDNLKDELESLKKKSS